MQQKSEIIQLLIDNEMALHDIYSLYSQMYPEVEEFWKKIAGEEVNHAGFIAALNAKIHEGKAYLNENRFSPESLRFVTDYVEKEKIKFQNEKYPLIQALSVSLDLEKSLLERKYFEVFEDDSADVRKLLDILRNSTEKHVAYVQARWEQEKSANAQ